MSGSVSIALVESSDLHPMIMLREELWFVFDLGDCVAAAVMVTMMMTLIVVAMAAASDDSQGETMVAAEHAQYVL